MNIFNISKQLEQIYLEIEDNDGEITPELYDALAITEANFKSKIQQYSELVKQVEYDVDAIDKELEKLQDLKKRKQHSIDSINRLLITFVNKYGDITKSGNKFIDFGTGKVSTRHTKKCVTNDTLIEAIPKGVFSYLNALAFNRQLECTDGIEEKDLYETLKTYTNTNTLCKEDLDNISTAITFNIPISEIVKGAGYRFIGNFINYIKDFKIKPSVNKTELKSAIENGTFTNLGTIEDNTTIQIK